MSANLKRFLSSLLLVFDCEDLSGLGLFLSFVLDYDIVRHLISAFLAPSLARIMPFFPFPSVLFTTELLNLLKILHVGFFQGSIQTIVRIVKLINALIWRCETPLSFIVDRININCVRLVKLAHSLI